MKSTSERMYRRGPHGCRIDSLLMRPLLSALLLLTLTGCSGSEEKPPNFIVILCDNLGYGDTEPFGSTLHRTPHLNRMAREGRKLTHFYASAGVCTPSRASLVTRWA